MKLSLAEKSLIIPTIICTAAWASTQSAEAVANPILRSLLSILFYWTFMPGALIVSNIRPPDYWGPWYAPLSILITGIMLGCLIYGFGRMTSKAR
jgi:hypothetical protein